MAMAAYEAVKQIDSIDGDEDNTACVFIYWTECENETTKRKKRGRRGTMQTLALLEH